jgi:AraC-like DNA-binding protein
MVREIIVLTPIYVSLFWSVVFLTNKFSVNKARYWLGVFMAVVAVLYSCHAVYFQGYEELYLKLDSLYLFSGLSVYPMYYIYVRLLTCDLKLKRSYILHFVPAFILFAALFVTGFFLNQDEEKLYYESVLVDNKWPGQEASSLLNTTAALFFSSRVIFGLQTLVYLFLGYMLAKKYNQRIANFYSNMEGRELVWVKLLTTSFLITSLASFVVNILGRGLFFEHDFILAVPSVLFSSLFFVIGLQGNKQDFTITSLSEDEDKESGTVKSNEDLRTESLKNELVRLLEDEKIYLNPELKITELCRELNTNRTYLSNLINHEFRVSFNDFINQYRVQHAISLFENGMGNNVSLNDMAAASGFGSLSSFNRAFKKNTGTTVGRYRFGGR